MTFWKNGIILKNWQAFHKADEATLRLINQKKGMHNGTIHDDVINDKSGYCLIRALAYRMQYIMSNGGYNMLGWHKVTSQNSTTVMKKYVIDTKLFKQGITLNDIALHSLRACGAITLKLNDINNTTIKKAGRWQSIAFFIIYS